MYVGVDRQLTSSHPSYFGVKWNYKGATHRRYTHAITKRQIDL